MASTAPPSLSSSYHEDLDKSLRPGSSSSYSSFSSLESMGLGRLPHRSSSSSPTCTHKYGRRWTPSSSRNTTPTGYLRSRHLSVSWPSTDSLNWSSSSSRATTPFRSFSRTARSHSPRPLVESDAIVAPGVQQEALTRAFLYPSSLHRNLRLAAMLLVTAHVSFKTLVPWLLLPLLDGITLDWTPRSLLIDIS
ncbi:hypothetical protein GWK47_020212 [Chionoecetes opilio]|uniref:Uncharacterized protein n=1 Tax=Chionoecetes opilio TaxID=41210 RepID=A0A8J5BWF4_CHIOP|nr:hypothetical protein GWK47_020212 [Chionoecetes opilio]